MTTSRSPAAKLRRQASEIAAKLKAAERGEVAFKDGARAKPTTLVGIVMDDKVLKVEFAWSFIRAASEAELTRCILTHMRRDAPPAETAH